VAREPWRRRALQFAPAVGWQLGLPLTDAPSGAAARSLQQHRALGGPLACFHLTINP
jgi:hypothetical protein